MDRQQDSPAILQLFELLLREHLTASPQLFACILAEVGHMLTVLKLERSL